MRAGILVDVDNAVVLCKHKIRKDNDGASVTRIKEALATVVMTGLAIQSPCPREIRMALRGERRMRRDRTLARRFGGSAGALSGLGEHIARRPHVP
jgi:hypothetical protein